MFSFNVFHITMLFIAVFIYFSQDNCMKKGDLVFVDSRNSIGTRQLPFGNYVDNETYVHLGYIIFKGNYILHVSLVSVYPKYQSELLTPMSELKDQYKILIKEIFND